ncbi:hypothetical protein GW17_00041052 [Ensete ventricosum]|nr:hypothetical protein GW17_00041052 [Ensete ventricosum]
MAYFYIDFCCACDAPAEVSQQWYQSQGGGAANHGQPLCKVGHPWSGQQRPQGVAARRGDAGGQKCRPRARPTTASPQGWQLLAAWRSQRGLAVGRSQGLLPTASRAGRGGGASRKGGRPLAGRLPTGKGNRSQRRGNSDDDDAEEERGVRASFGGKDDPTPMNLENFEGCPRCGGDSETHDAGVGDYDVW